MYKYFNLRTFQGRTHGNLFLLYFKDYCSMKLHQINILLNEAEKDMKNSADQGRCYPPQLLTSSRICRILHIL